MNDIMNICGAVCIADTMNPTGRIVTVMVGMPKRKVEGQPKPAWNEQQPLYVNLMFDAAWNGYLDSMAAARTSKSLKGAWVDFLGTLTLAAAEGTPSLTVAPLLFDFASNERHDVDDTSCTADTYRYHGGMQQLELRRLRVFSDRTLESIRAASAAGETTPAYLTFDAAHSRPKGAPEEAVNISYHLLFGNKTVKQADKCLYGGSHIDVSGTITGVNLVAKGEKTYINVYVSVDKFQLSPSITAAERAASQPAAPTGAPAPVSAAPVAGSVAAAPVDDDFPTNGLF